LFPSKRIDALPLNACCTTPSTTSSCDLPRSGSRRDLLRQLTERLGLGPGATPDVLAEVTVARTGVARDRVARAVTDLPVRSEAELLALAHDIDTIRTEVLHGIHS